MNTLQRLDKELEVVPLYDTPEEDHEAFSDTCIRVARKLFGCPRSTPSKKTKDVLQLYNDARAVTCALYYVRTNRPIPPAISRRKVFKSCDMSADSLLKLKNSTRDGINSKGRKRAARTRRLFIAKRSKLFFTSLGGFLCSALSKWSSFIGVQSISTQIQGPYHQTQRPPVKWLLTVSRTRSTNREYRPQRSSQHLAQLTGLSTHRDSGNFSTT